MGSVVHSAMFCILFTAVSFYFYYFLTQKFVANNVTRHVVIVSANIQASAEN